MKNEERYTEKIGFAPCAPFVAWAPLRAAAVWACGLPLPSP
jgi:hypothetical protein